MIYLFHLFHIVGSRCQQLHDKFQYAILKVSKFAREKTPVFSFFRYVGWCQMLDSIVIPIHWSCLTSENYQISASIGFAKLRDSHAHFRYVALCFTCHCFLCVFVFYVSVSLCFTCLCVLNPCVCAFVF